MRLILKEPFDSIVFQAFHFFPGSSIGLFGDFHVAPRKAFKLLSWMSECGDSVSQGFLWLDGGPSVGSVLFFFKHVMLFGYSHSLFLVDKTIIQSFLPCFDGVSARLCSQQGSLTFWFR